MWFWSLMLILGGEARPPASDVSPYFGNPALRGLLEAVTFYQSFDHESLVPDMAMGSWNVQTFGSPRLSPGLWGQALMAGTGAVLYPAADNWTITSRGAISFWLCPVQWDHQQADNTNFLLSSSSALFLERQGPLRRPDSQWERLEGLLFGLQRPPTGCVALDCTGWKDGEWHFIVANWSWPRLEISVDGSDFAAVELKGKPAPDLFGDLMLGSQGGDLTLLDEVFCFKRPLSVQEARLLREAVCPRE